MNQYKRIVSYIYRYDKEQKGSNVGYARIEKKKEMCRIQVQMRENREQKNCRVYLFRQHSQGIEPFYMGEMTVMGEMLVFKTQVEDKNIFQSGLTIDEMDGILIDWSEECYFATSWKNDSIFLGNWRGKVSGEGTEKERVQEVAEIRGEIQESDANRSEIDELPEKQTMVTAEQKENESETAETAGQQEDLQGIFAAEEKETEESVEKGAESEAEGEMQMQSICGVCPFKRQHLDYGKKILNSFPGMRPFSEKNALRCVKLELQDIGCLPMKFWSLSGNRFLLHGYYCYRHLIFLENASGEYQLGVPGIYSEREEKNAEHFGFREFRSIGDFEKRQGAFGYWMLPLIKES